jgi:hypothetical protein
MPVTSKKRRTVPNIEDDIRKSGKRLKMLRKMASAHNKANHIFVYKQDGQNVNEESLKAQMRSKGMSTESHAAQLRNMVRTAENKAAAKRQNETHIRRQEARSDKGQSTERAGAAFDNIIAKYGQGKRTGKKAKPAAKPAAKPSAKPAAKPAAAGSAPHNSASAQVGGTGGEQGCVGAALPATTAGSGGFGVEGTERVLADQVQ